jgi:NADH dehydrogenase FAD-containing subunit
MIVDRKIKLKAGSAIESFNENSIRFEDGDEVQADVVVFATGSA